MDFSCTICMESYGTNCAIATIPCGHVFHEACIERWHIGEKNCAICRKECKAWEISKLFMSESESALKHTDICTEYEKKILNLEKEIHDLKADKQKVNFSELNEKNLRLKAENVRLELGWKECEKKLFTLNGTSLESRMENIKLCTKMIDLKSHERNVQKSLRDALDRKNKENKENLIKFHRIKSFLNTKQSQLEKQIAETEKAEGKIKALQEKYLNWVPPYHSPRRNNKRKQQLQDKSATMNPPKNKKKKQPAEESDTPVSTPEDTPTPSRTSRSRSRSSSPSLRFSSLSRSPIRYVQDDSNAGEQSCSRSSSPSYSRTSTQYSPNSPGYTLTSPRRSRFHSSLPIYSGSSTQYSPNSPGYTPTSPRSRSRSSSGSSLRFSSNSSRSSSPSYSNSRTSTGYSPNSPGYTPASRQYSPASQSYSQDSPQYSPNSSGYSPTTPSYSSDSSDSEDMPTSQTYSPISPAYSPTSHHNTLTSEAYSPSSPSYSPALPEYSPPAISDRSESSDSSDASEAEWEHFIGTLRGNKKSRWNRKSRLS